MEASRTVFQHAPDRHSDLISVKFVRAITSSTVIFLGIIFAGCTPSAWADAPSHGEFLHNRDSITVILGALLFTGLTGFIFILAATRNNKTTLWVKRGKGYALPMLVFTIAAASTLYLHHVLNLKEEAVVKNIVTEQAAKIRLLIENDTNNKLLALKRMGQRWEAAEGTPEHLWRNDASNYIGHLAGLRVLEWVDSTYHVQWVEPPHGTQALADLNILDSGRYEDTLKLAAERDTIAITAPFDLMPGYKGFIAYSPIKKGMKFDGFMTAIFTVDAFFSQSISQEVRDHFDIALLHNGQVFFTSKLTSGVLVQELASRSIISLYDSQWVLQLVPSQEYTESYYTLLPTAVLIAGLLIALLLALIMRAILVAKVTALNLADSNKLNNAIMSDAANLIIAADPDGKIVVFNKAAEEALGYKASEIIGTYSAMLWHDPEEVSRRAAELSVEAGLDAFVNTPNIQGSETSEWTYVRKDGSRFPASLTVTTLRDEQGEISGYVGIIQDITEQKQADKKLKDALQELHAILDTMVDGPIIIDQGGIVRTFTPTAERIFGYSAEEVVGQNISMLMPEPDHSKHDQYLKNYHETGVKKIIGIGREVKARRKDGSIFSMELEISEYTVGDQKRFVGIVRDVTDRKETEEALKMSKETFRSAIEHASIGMALVNPKGRWQQVNPALCDLLGYSQEELLDNDFQSITHPEDLDMEMIHINKLLVDDIKTFKLEKRFYHRSGKIIWALASVSLVRYASGEPNYLIMQIQDITEQKEIERIKSEFISIVSHELRTPLTSIRGSLGLILGVFSIGLSDKVKGLIEIAHNNCERLSLLINDILDIDKIAAGQMRFDMKMECLSHIIQQAVEANEAYAQKFGVHIVMHPMDDTIKVEVDPERFIQVLTNLISNACKFSPAGAAVEIHARRIGDLIRVSVQDHGPGIAEDFRARIFGKFSQEDSSVTRTKGGTGLGLHITKQIVEHMNGDIGFETELDKGTTFWVELPKVVTEALPALDMPSFDNSRGLPVIIHVEEDLDLSDVLATALHDRAHVVTAATLSQAEQMLKQRPFDLLVLDINMPDGNGLTLLDHLDTLCNKPLPVAILSCDPPPETLKHHVDAVLVKSRVSETKIVETILDILSKHKGERLETSHSKHPVH